MDSVQLSLDIWFPIFLSNFLIRLSSTHFFVVLDVTIRFYAHSHVSMVVWIWICLLNMLLLNRIVGR